MSNRSSLPPPEIQREIRALWETYNTVYFATGILIAILAIITVVGNGALLLAIWKDPFKSFRTPTTIFVIDLALADLITGVIVGPCASYVSFLYHLKLRLGQHKETYDTLTGVSSHVASITMNASFLLLLALTCCQFEAIHNPYKHRDVVTKRRVVMVVVGIWIYSILLSLLTDFGVPYDIAREIDIHLNTNIVLVFLLLAYGCLFVAFLRHLNNIRSLEENQANQERRRQQERRFTSVNLLLVTFLLICALPSIVIWHLLLYRFPAQRFESPQQRARFAIAQVLAQALLQVKFALDPFAYAWRLPKYRQALKKLMPCGKRSSRQEDAGSGNTLSTSGTGQTAATVQLRRYQRPEP